MADPHPASNEDKAPTPGSLPPAKVEHRENVGTATPDDYPKTDREHGDVTTAGNGGRQADEQDRGPTSKNGDEAGGGGTLEDYDDDPKATGGRKTAYTGDRPATHADAPVDES